MYLWLAAVLAVACFIGAVYMRAAWLRRRKRSQLMLSIVLLAASGVLALYMGLVFVFVDAIQ